MNKYNEIEISQEEMSELDNAGLPAEPVEATETTMSEEPETVAEDPVIDVDTVIETEVVDDRFEIDGERYEVDTIKEWMKDSQNKSEWQKSNTEKAQKLSQWNKLSEKINGDDEFREHIKDYFFDNPEAYTALGLDGELPVAEEPEVLDPVSSALEGRLDALEKMESDRILDSRVDALDSQLSQLEESHPSLLGEAKSMEFLDFVENNHERFIQNGIPNLQTAFKEWSYDAMQDQLAHYKQLTNNKSRNEGKVINTSEVGARETKSPNKYTSFKQLSVKDPDIAKYFE